MVHSTGPQAWLLPAGLRSHDISLKGPARVNSGTPRLHLQHGPIDVIIEAVGRADEVEKSYQQAGQAFSSVLDVLVAQLALLRQTISDEYETDRFSGDIARRMFRAAEPFRDYWVTPMIAVAGAVADHLLAAMRTGRELDRIQVNNGGDIALYLSPDSTCRIGICTSTSSTQHADVISLHADSGIGGVATSGWQGRSYSLGIADAVTVLADDAASADAAATLIANAIDLPDSSKVRRVAANCLSPDSDLGERLVTIAVERLCAAEKQSALQTGCTCARQLLERGLIAGAYLNLQGSSRVVGATFDDINLTLASTGI
ncbi:UPF0280 family protein [Granulosicoccus antarcticus]|uniref:Uncharacterized protein n=1 Tax=Granulosicoccus antarcticus IMCC3135 TaxID=1192854 RepID=A0A2Z2NN63_9GAMM|nr:UPF0280 family protein [Granulosicoccus antarcticus]ASJ71361.1 hypothetical protein IMCC3135_06270 [Granulosicoccus antarcticus IMCC3135]